MNVEPKRCAGCGQMFIPKTEPQRYCGPACYRLARARQKLKAAEPKENRMAITEIEAAARKHGLTYGQFMAKRRMEGKID